MKRSLTKIIWYAIPCDSATIPYELLRLTIPCMWHNLSSVVLFFEYQVRFVCTEVVIESFTPRYLYTNILVLCTLFNYSSQTQEIHFLGELRELPALHKQFS